MGRMVSYILAVLAGALGVAYAATAALPSAQDPTVARRQAVVRIHDLLKQASADGKQLAREAAEEAPASLPAGRDERLERMLSTTLAELAVCEQSDDPQLKAAAGRLGAAVIRARNDLNQVATARTANDEQLAASATQSLLFALADARVAYDDTAVAVGFDLEPDEADATLLRPVWPRHPQLRSRRESPPPSPTNL